MKTSIAEGYQILKSLGLRNILFNWSEYGQYKYVHTIQQSLGKWISSCGCAVDEEDGLAADWDHSNWFLSIIYEWTSPNIEKVSSLLKVLSPNRIFFKQLGFILSSWVNKRCLWVAYKGYFKKNVRIVRHLAVLLRGGGGGGGDQLRSHKWPRGLWLGPTFDYNRSGPIGCESNCSGPVGPWAGSIRRAPVYHV